MLLPEIETTKQGYMFITVTLSQIYEWGGYGICDSCNAGLLSGKYIPVLNSCYCTNCFNEWQDNAKYYPEDVKFEKEALSHMLSKLI